MFWLFQQPGKSNKRAPYRFSMAWSQWDLGLARPVLRPVTRPLGRSVEDFTDQGWRTCCKSQAARYDRRRRTPETKRHDGKRGAESLKAVWDRLVSTRRNVALFVLKQQRRGSGQHTAAGSELLIHHS